MIAIAARDPELLSRARSFSRQGLIRDPDRFRLVSEGLWHQEVHNFGLNYRLPDVLAALGSSQLQRLGQFKERRAAIKTSYDVHLRDASEVRVPVQRADVDPLWHLYPVRVPAEKRHQIFDSLRSHGFGVQVNYIPVYWHPVFDPIQYPRGLCPIAESFYQSEISLPMFTDLDLRTVESVSRALLATL